MTEFHMSESKLNHIDSLVQWATTQHRIKTILDKYFTVVDKDINGTKPFDKILYLMADNYDIDYKTGTDSNLGSDGKAHNFGKLGKFAKCGDNIPAGLQYAKNAVENALIDFVN